MWTINQKRDIAARVIKDLTIQIYYFYEHDEHIIERKMLNVDMMNGFLVVDNEKMSHIQFADLLNVEVPKPS